MATESAQSVEQTDEESAPDWKGHALAAILMSFVIMMVAYGVAEVHPFVGLIVAFAGNVSVIIYVCNRMIKEYIEYYA